MSKNLLIFFFCFTFLFNFDGYSQKTSSLIPTDTHQIILVLTDSASASKGFLYRFERNNESNEWELVADTIPVVLGRNGLAWGRGLYDIDSSVLSIKVEGDGKSPAGIFYLGSAFGYDAAEKMKNIKIPYLQITQSCECVDDMNSEFYNQIVNKDEIKTIDWETSEKMFYADIYYEQGVIVQQNNNPILKGAGSCIFLHNWAEPNETTAGCTEMSPANLREVISWLNPSSKPILVQLTKPLFEMYQQKWALPEY